MSLTATYDDANARVTLSVSGAPAGTPAVRIQRSTNQTNWTDVRGATALPLVGGAASVEDYEYTAGVPNYYRTMYTSTAAVSFVGSGSGSTGDFGTRTPGAPSNVQPGDVVYLMASVGGNTAAAPVVPSGWTTVIDGGQVKIFARTWQTGDTMPSVTYTGGATGNPTAAQAAAFRGVGLQPVVKRTLATASTQNVPWAPISVPELDSCAVVVAIWKDSTESGHALPTIAGLSTTNLGGTVASSPGAGVDQFWAAVFPTAPLAVSAGTAGVSGGTVTDAKAFTFALGPLNSQPVDSASVTPNQTLFWLKSPLRPFLNKAVTPIALDDLSRTGRLGVFDVIGRSLPIGVTDLMSGYSSTITFRATDKTEADDLDAMVQTGEVLLLAPPSPDATIPQMYVVPGGMARQRVANTSAVRYIQVPITQVAAPDPTLAAVQATWQTVVNTYTDWSDLIADRPTWADLLLLIGSASDVITN